MTATDTKLTEVTTNSMATHRPILHRAVRLSGLFVLITALTSCATGRIDPTDPIGENAKQIDGLMRLSGYLAAAVGVFVAIAVAVVIVKFRARPDDDPNDLPEQIHGNKKAELTWTIIPVILLVFLTVITIPAVFDLSGKGDGRTIKVEGQQWWWQFSYDIDEDGTPDIVTANDLVIPVGEASQAITIVTKQPAGPTSEVTLPVRFVPMTGEAIR